MSLKHSEERLRTTYVELVKKNSQLEEKLLEQDSRHEEQKQKFENSIMKLTNKLIQQRKRSEELEQANARAVRDCRYDRTLGEFYLELNTLVLILSTLLLYK